MTQKFCCVPWKELWLDPELRYGMCCKERQDLIAHSDSATVSIMEHWQNQNLQDIRQRFLQAQPVPECQTCWDQEADGKISMRIRKNLRYLGTAEPTPAQHDLLRLRSGDPGLIQGILISTGNQCQLRCITCNPSYSRSIIKDYQKLGWTIHNKTRFDSHNSSLALHQLSEHNIDAFKTITPQLDWITLVGGEPSMSRPILKYLQWCTDQGHSSRIILMVTTNAVNVKQEFIDAMRAFKRVMLTVSIDGYGELDEYLRWPSRWQKKIEFLDQCTSIFPELNVHTVVTSLNVLALDQLIAFVKSREIRHSLECITWPAELAAEHLPDDAKMLAQSRLAAAMQLFQPKSQDLYDPDSYTLNCVRAIIARLDVDRSPQMWQQANSVISAYNGIRPKSLYELLPELERYAALDQ